MQEDLSVAAIRECPVRADAFRAGNQIRDVLK